MISQKVKICVRDVAFTVDVNRQCYGNTSHSMKMTSPVQPDRLQCSYCNRVKAGRIKDEWVDADVWMGGGLVPVNMWWKKANTGKEGAVIVTSLGLRCLSDLQIHTSKWFWTSYEVYQEGMKNRQTVDNLGRLLLSLLLLLLLWNLLFHIRLLATGRTNVSFFF